ncbi:hypothetical protein K0M31_018436 [Melipona bicolor]|uniref:Uncharacterized protein n=1 Tax=Melipona bicolor TaxID=60889 RepID=A0AA40KRL0_9HYME|nr:hypothetical protein K0M31_018436 [Melipona bicolor]
MCLVTSVRKNHDYTLIDLKSKSLTNNQGMNQSDPISLFVRRATLVHSSKLPAIFRRHSPEVRLVDSSPWRWRWRRRRELCFSYTRNKPSDCGSRHFRCFFVFRGSLERGKVKANDLPGSKVKSIDQAMNRREHATVFTINPRPTTSLRCGAIVPTTTTTTTATTASRTADYSGLETSHGHRWLACY